MAPRRVDIRSSRRIFFSSNFLPREERGGGEERANEGWSRASRDVEGNDGLTPRRVEICISKEKKERRGALPWRKKKGKENESSDILRFRGVGIEATKGLPLPNDLSVFVSRLTHRREILVKPSCCSFPSLSLSRALPLFFFTSSLSLFLFRLVAGGRLHARCFHSLCRSNRDKTPVKNLPPASLLFFLSLFFFNEPDFVKSRTRWTRRTVLSLPRATPLASPRASLLIYLRKKIRKSRTFALYLFRLDVNYSVSGC